METKLMPLLDDNNDDYNKNEIKCKFKAIFFTRMRKGAYMHILTWWLIILWIIFYVLELRVWALRIIPSHPWTIFEQNVTRHTRRLEEVLFHCSINVWCKCKRTEWKIWEENFMWKACAAKPHSTD